MTRTDIDTPTTPAHNAGPSTALRAGSIGVFALMFFVFSTQAPLTGLGGATAFTVGIGDGAGAPGAYVLVGIVIAIFAIGFVAISRRAPTEGGFYAYVSLALGRRLGASAGWLAILTYVTIAAGSYGLYGVTVAGLVGTLGIQLPWWAYVAITLAFVHFMGTRSVELGAKVLAILVAVEVALLVAFAVKVLLTGGGPEGLNLPASFAPPAVLSGAPGVAVVFALAAMFGFESTAIYAAEAKNPRTTVARATYFSVILIALFFGFVSWMIVSFYGPAKAGPAALHAIMQGNSTAFVFNAIIQELGPWAGVVARVLLCTSLLASVMALNNSVNRYLHSLSLHGSLPRSISRTNSYLAPSRAAILQTALMIVLVAPFAVLGLNPAVTLFAWAGGVSVAALITVYILTSIAIVVFFARERGTRHRWQTAIAPVVAGVLLLGMLGLIITNFGSLVGGSTSLTVILLALIPATGVAGFVAETITHRPTPTRPNKAASSTIP